MAASMTALPVLGVPVKSKALQGMDSLLSTVSAALARLQSLLNTGT
jgi:phosphoribosylcarboxyaminoimidazole (NCAIR) mutase